MKHQFLSVYCSHCGITHPVPVRCSDRFCPVCTRSVKARTRRRLNFIIDNTPKQYAHRWYFGSLSERNCTDLAQGIKSLIRAFRRFRQTQYFQNQVFGGVYIIEITGTPGNWHPHIHYIVYTRYLKYSKLIKLWKKVSNGIACYHEDIPESAAVGYVTKYMAKPDMLPDVYDQVCEGLKGMRWVSPFGQCHNLSKQFPKHKALSECCNAPFEIFEFKTYYDTIDRWLAHQERNKSPASEELFTRQEARGR